MTLEARSVRDGDFHHLIFDADTRCHLAAEPPLALAGLRRLGFFVHATRFDRGPALQALQPGDLFALFAGNLFQGSDFAEQFNQQSLKLCTTKPGKVGWRRHIRQESYRVEPKQEKNAGAPTFLPLLLLTGVGRAYIMENKASSLFGMGSYIRPLLHQTAPPTWLVFLGLADRGPFLRPGLTF